MSYVCPIGRATAQAVNRWVRARVSLCGSIVDKVAMVMAFYMSLGFPCQFHPIIWGMIIGLSESTAL
jgi:hypothetical protein